jgi:hypothetical protein
MPRDLLEGVDVESLLSRAEGRNQPAPPKDLFKGIDPDVIEQYAAQMQAAQQQQQQEAPGRLENFIDMMNPQKSMDASELPSGVRVGETDIPIGKLLASVRGNVPASLGVAAQQMPGVDVGVDPQGAPFVDIPREAGYFPHDKMGVQEPGFTQQGPPEPLSGQYYLNAPGASEQDARDLATLGLQAYVGATPGGLAKSAIGRAAGVFGGEFGAELGMQIVGKQAGSGEPISWKEALFTATMGVAGDAAIGSIALMRRMLPDNTLSTASGELTEKGNKIFEAAGIDKRSITPEMVRYFRKRATRGVKDPKAAAVMAEAESLPTPVGLTPGQITGNEQQLGREAAMASGSRGLDEQAAMQQHTQQQQQQFLDNIPQLQEEITGLPPLPPGEGIATAVKRMQDMGAAAKEGTDLAYSAARQGRAALPARAVEGFRDQALQALKKEGFSDLRDPDLRDVRFALRQMSEVVNSKNTVAVKLKFLEDTWRKRTVAGKIDKHMKSGSAAGPALIALRKAYDGWIEGAIDGAVSALGRGAEGARKNFDQWKNARSMHSRMSEMFRSDEIVKKLLKGNYENRTALDMVFGASKAGFRKEASKALVKIKNILGPNSDEWNMVKGEAFLRLMRTHTDNADFGMDIAQKNLNGVLLANTFDRALKDSPEVMRTLFNPSQIGRMKNLRNVAVRMTGKTGVKEEQKGLMDDLVIRMWRGLVGQNSAVMYGEAMASRLLGTQGIYGQKAARKSLEVELEHVPLIGGGPFMVPRTTGAAVGATVGHEKAKQKSWEQQKKSLGLK